MRNRLKKMLESCPLFIREFFEIVFASAAENHIKITKAGRQKFRSYTQLKRHQKNVRRFVAVALLSLVSLLLGILVGPIFFPQPIEGEVYIPNGKGDILIGNVSKNQATVIFKTLDSANGNMPLATKAIVEFYEDAAYSDLARRTSEDDYAVTHIIPVNNLQENKIYYIKIIAKDAAVPAHLQAIASWGGGNDPIKVYTTGDLVPDCASSDLAGNKDESVVGAIIASTEDANLEAEKSAAEPIANTESLQIENVQNENYLQPRNKVQSIISWTTSAPASTVIIYGEEKSGEKRQVTISEQLSLKHAAILTTLKPGSTYYFSVQSKDVQGSVVNSEEYSLRTPRSQENIIQKISNNFKGLLLQIKPR